VSLAAASTAWRIEPWDLRLQEPQAMRIRACAQALTEALSATQERQAWLVLDAWEANPAAAWLEQRYPDWLQGRHTVADPAFHGMPEWAPCLLPLHAWAEHEPDEAMRTDTLHDLIGLMWLDAQQRLVRSHISGVLLSSAPVDQLLEHWLLLGSQLTPDGQRKPLRHFDPRVLQRLWPSLSTAQRQTYLGPAHSYWQLEQAWGPWAPEDLPRQPHELVGEEVAWHIATLTDPPGSTNTPMLVPHRLLTLAQHQTLRAHPPAQIAWQTMARAKLPVAAQPTASAMQRLCTQLHDWFATHQAPWSDEHAGQWLWCTWLGPNSQQPRLDQAQTGPAIDWLTSPWRERSTELVRRLREEPDADLRTHFEEMQSAAQAEPHALAQAA
jgi:hypothetical protein